MIAGPAANRPKRETAAASGSGNRRRRRYHPRMSSEEPARVSASSGKTVPSLRAVAFDLDGLMFNTEAVFHRTLTELLGRRGKPAPPELFAAMMGRRATEATTLMIEMMELSESLSEISAEISELFALHLEDILQPTPGLFELLDHLEATGRPKAVCTSSGTDYAHGMLERFDLQDRFAFVLAAEDVTQGKPHPEVYETAAVRHGVPASALLVLEDAAHGVAAGNAAGAFTVAVPHEHTIGQSHDAADLVAESLTDPRLLALLP